MSFSGPRLKVETEATTTASATNNLGLKLQRVNDLLLLARVASKTLTLETSSYCFAVNVIAMPSIACCTCCKIIFAHSTNRVIVFLALVWPLPQSLLKTSK